MAQSLRTFDVLGTPLVATDYDEFVRHCQSLAQRGGTYAVDLTNIHIVTLRRHDPHFLAVTSRFDYFVPDGMPLIWCLNARGAALRDRVYGPTFMRRCIAQSPAPWKHYLLGGSAECLEALQQKLESLHSGVSIVGKHHGYFLPNEERTITDEINRLSPDFIWVGSERPSNRSGFIARGTRSIAGLF